MDRWIDLSVGSFMILGILCLGYLSVSFGEVRLFAGDRYPVKAVFSNVTGLQENTEVEISGIKVGTVQSIGLRDYRAEVTMMMRQDIDLQEDAIASIRTRGLLGEKYISISPGGYGDVIAKDGTGRIRETESAVILEELIGKAMFGGSDSSP